MQCYQLANSVTKINCYCDNLGIILTLQSLNSKVITRPNDMTNDDYNIYLAIQTAATRNPALQIQYWHVKGHQDNDPNHHLTVEEQHNIDCDKLAKTFISEHPQCSTMLANPKFSVAELHLKIHGKLVCRKVLLNLQQAAAAPPYWEYLRKRFTWTHSDLLAIQWDTFKTVLNSFLRNDQRRMILFTHDKLALRTSKFHPHLGSQMCPSCQCEPEDRWHFLECQHMEQQCLFSTLRWDLTDITMKYSLHPVVLTTFWLGMLTIRNDTPYPDVHKDLPPVLRLTIKAQTQIGWDQLYHGRVAHLWEKAIDQLNPHLKVSGRYIVIQMIKTIWKYILTVWAMCNHHLHQDAGHLSQPNYQQAVRMLYELRPQLPPETQDALFQCPLEQMLEQSPAFLRVWIERSHRYIQQQLKAAQKRAKINTPDIRSFFTRHNTSANDLHPP